MKAINSILSESKGEYESHSSGEEVIEELMNLKSVEWAEKKDSDLEKQVEAKVNPAKKEEKSDSDSEYFISNAGLILLHPYLPSFFKKLGYISENNEWLNEKSWIQAVLITEYLVPVRKELMNTGLF